MLDILSEELSRSETKYFIFDTGKHDNTDQKSVEGDIDFQRYTWSRKRFNKVNSGDLFIYRKTSSASDNKIFYFYGIGKIHILNDIHDNLVHGLITKGILFDEYVTRDDLDANDFEWDSKTKKSQGYARFFSFYGMDQISKRDFLGLCSLGLGNDYVYDKDDSEEKINTHNNIENEDYTVEDQFTSGSKIRGSAQNVFSNKVKNAYNWKCCISGINSKSLLVGAHIVPWSERKNTRADPRNGLCLNIILHKCFDEGLFSLSDDFKVIVGIDKIKDIILKEILVSYSGKGISLPGDKRYYPLLEYLDYHRDKHGF